jgi:hypothetical protein
LLFLRALGCENATKIPQFQKNENSLSLLSCSNANDMSEYGKRMNSSNRGNVSISFFYYREVKKWMRSLLRVSQPRG